MTSVSVAIQAHISRGAYVTELLATLDRPAAVTWDLSPATADREHRWRVAARAWEQAASDADPDGWTCVIQDDALISDDFTVGLERAVAHTGDAVVSGYFGQRRPQATRCNEAARLARQHDASWIVTPSVLWAVALAIPAHLVEQMLTWTSRPSERGKAIDTRIGRWAHRRVDIPTRCTWPSLADHRRGASLCGNSDMDRRAHHWHQGSALDLDWTGATVDATRTPPGVLEMQR